MSLYYIYVKKTFTHCRILTGPPVLSVDEISYLNKMPSPKITLFHSSKHMATMVWALHSNKWASGKIKHILNISFERIKSGVCCWTLMCDGCAAVMIIIGVRVWSFLESVENWIFHCTIVWLYVRNYMLRQTIDTTISKKKLNNWNSKLIAAFSVGVRR